jgi:hypothetical protein
VIAPPSGPRRNAVRPATSSGETNRPSGGCAGGVRARPGSDSIGVSVGPGAITFTVMPRPGQFRGPGARERGQGGLGRGVLALAGYAGGGAAADEDHAGSVGQAVGERVDEDRGGVDVYPPHQLAVVRGQFGQRCRALEPGGVHEGVRGGYAVEDSDQLGGLGQIRREPGQPRCGYRPAAADPGGLPSLPQQASTDRRADSRAVTGDQGVPCLSHGRPTRPACSVHSVKVMRATSMLPSPTRARQPSDEPHALVGVDAMHQAGMVRFDTAAAAASAQACTSVDTPDMCPFQVFGNP